MTRRWVFRLVAASVIAVAGWWILDEGEPDPRPDTELLERERRPDYFIEQFVLDVTDESGVATYRLRSPRMTHFMDDDLWLLETPWLTLFTETGEPWHLRAERGRAWDNVTQAHLEGEVTLRRAAGPDNLEANVDTSEVYARPAEHYAETDRFAVYYREGARVSGIGAEAYLDRDLFRLHSEVKGIYEPAQDD